MLAKDLDVRILTFERARAEQPRQAQGGISAHAAGAAHDLVDAAGGTPMP